VRACAGNGGSLEKCRRQWDICDSQELRYKDMCAFDRAMCHLDKAFGFISAPHQWVSRQCAQDKVAVIERGDLLFVFNFHPEHRWVRACVRACARQDSVDTAVRTAFRPHLKAGEVDSLNPIQRCSDDTTVVSSPLGASGRAAWRDRRPMHTDTPPMPERSSSPPRVCLAPMLA
jgi:hypothetical protein